jgi:hypothetical protein
MITTTAGRAAQQQARSANLSARQSTGAPTGAAGVVSGQATGGAAGLRCKSLAVISPASRPLRIAGRALPPVSVGH